ncbi:hypothetical protein ACIBL5_34990 [Streptomyces sp. NPDC050516]|uniref:hypothetical protein n=1 Tax=Streptomyces sp. NPDC050516 TaxID=3365621 RepID=UPI0037ABC335
MTCSNSSRSRPAPGLPDEHVVIVIVAEHNFGASSWKWRAYPLSESDEYPKQ